MSAAAARPEREPGTEIAVIERSAIGTLPPEIQHQFELRKAANQIAGQLAALNWGKSLDLATRRAVADWGQQHGVDTTTEIHVLGGNIYIAASYYLRRLGDLIKAGLVEYAIADHVEDDERLKRLGAEGEGEATRRLRERIKYGVPDKAAAAVVFRVKLRALDREIVGVKWCGNGTRKNDPVGDACPMESAESRAARRAMRQVVSHVPQFAQDLEVIESAAVTVSDDLKASHARFVESDAANRIAPKNLGEVSADDPYRLAAPRAETTEPAPAPAPASDDHGLDF